MQRAQPSWDGGWWCSDAVVGHSAAASELFSYFFQKKLYHPTPLLLLFIDPLIFSPKTHTKDLDLRCKFRKKEKKQERMDETENCYLYSRSAKTLRKRKTSILLLLFFGSIYPRKHESGSVSFFCTKTGSDPRP